MTKPMHKLYDDGDDDSVDKNNNSEDDGDKKTFIIWLAISAGINLLLIVAISVTCCGMKISSKLK